MHGAYSPFTFVLSENVFRQGVVVLVNPACVLFSAINSMDVKLVLTQFYLRIGLAYTYTVIIESSNKKLASID